MKSILLGKPMLSFFSKSDCNILHKTGSVRSCFNREVEEYLGLSFYSKFSRLYYLNSPYQGPFETDLKTKLSGITQL